MMSAIQLVLKKLMSKEGYYLVVNGIILTMDLGQNEN
jgi:hypothetical protein